MFTRGLIHFHLLVFGLGRARGLHASDDEGRTILFSRDSPYELVESTAIIPILKKWIAALGREDDMYQYFG